MIFKVLKRVSLQKNVHVIVEIVIVDGFVYFYIFWIMGLLLGFFLKELLTGDKLCFMVL